MKTIAFYSYKGGVGRTLALSNIAIRLSNFGKKVVMLDLDLEAPGLQCKFENPGFTDKIEKGIVDYIYEFAENQRVPKHIKEYLYTLNSNFTKNLRLIPAGNPDSPNYWRKLSAINWHELLYGDNSEGISFFLDLKNKIEKELRPDYLLIDTRTGITDISSLTISLLADTLVLLAANNKENIEGCRRIVRSLLASQNNLQDKEKDIILALTRIPYPSSAEEKVREEIIVKNFQSHFEGIQYSSGKETDFKPVIIHSDRKIECNEEFKIGYNYEIENNKEIISREYLELFGRITANDFTEKEIEQFNKEKEKEKFYYEVKKLGSPAEIVLKLKESIPTYNKDYYLYWLLASNLLKLRDYKEALQAINNAINLKGQIFRQFHVMRSTIYYCLMEYEKAYYESLPLKSNYSLAHLVYCSSEGHLQYPKEIVLKDFEELIKADSSAQAYNSLAYYLRSIGEYDKALKNIFIALELDKKNAGAYSTLAEIKAEQGDNMQFYFNIGMALDYDLDIVQAIKETPEIYSKYKGDKQFINLLLRYDKEDAVKLLETL